MIVIDWITVNYDIKQVVIFRLSSYVMVKAEFTPFHGSILYSEPTD